MIHLVLVSHSQYQRSLQPFGMKLVASKNIYYIELELEERSCHKERAARLCSLVEPAIHHFTHSRHYTHRSQLLNLLFGHLPKSKEPSTDRRSCSRLVSYRGHPIRGKDLLPSKVVNLIEVTTVICGMGVGDSFFLVS